LLKLINRDFQKKKKKNEIISTIKLISNYKLSNNANCTFLPYLNGKSFFISNVTSTESIGHDHDSIAVHIKFTGGYAKHISKSNLIIKAKHNNNSCIFWRLLAANNFPICQFNISVYIWVF
jgi:hypothetical protein